MDEVKRPHKSVTTLDWMELERTIKGLGLVVTEAEKYDDERSRQHAAFLHGAIAAFTWVAGGPSGSELYTAILEGASLLRAYEKEN